MRRRIGPRARSLRRNKMATTLALTIWTSRTHCGLCKRTIEKTIQHMAELTVRVRLLNSKRHTTPLYNIVPNTGSTYTRKSWSNNLNVSVKNCTLAIPVFSVRVCVAPRYSFVYFALGRSVSTVVFAILQLISYMQDLCIIHRWVTTLQIVFN